MNITLTMSYGEAETLKFCLEEALDSNNETRAKYARIFIDEICEAEMKAKETAEADGNNCE